jgi:hypothetical protein
MVVSQRVEKQATDFSRTTVSSFRGKVYDPKNLIGAGVEHQFEKHLRARMNSKLGFHSTGLHSTCDQILRVVHLSSE